MPGKSTVSYPRNLESFAIPTASSRLDYTAVRMHMQDYVPTVYVP